MNRFFNVDSIHKEFPEILGASVLASLSPHKNETPSENQNTSLPDFIGITSPSSSPISERNQEDNKEPKEKDAPVVVSANNFSSNNDSSVVDRLTDEKRDVQKLLETERSNFSKKINEIISAHEEEKEILKKTIARLEDRNRELQRQLEDEIRSGSGDSEEECSTDSMDQRSVVSVGGVKLTPTSPNGNFATTMNVIQQSSSAINSRKKRKKTQDQILEEVELLQKKGHLPLEELEKTLSVSKATLVRRLQLAKLYEKYPQTRELSQEKALQFAKVERKRARQEEIEKYNQKARVSSTLPPSTSLSAIPFSLSTLQQKPPSFESVAHSPSKQVQNHNSSIIQHVVPSQSSPFNSILHSQSSLELNLKLPPLLNSNQRVSNQISLPSLSPRHSMDSFAVRTAEIKL